VQGAREALQDEQAHINNYIHDVKYDSGAVLPLVASPVQFDEEPATLSPGPDHAADTDEVLLAAGYDWDQLIVLKEKNAIS
jgi:crotonobetainyl-CoA:carnitine CoA-transferase CaiB-like acyl-CoA transferase